MLALYFRYILVFIIADSFNGIGIGLTTIPAYSDILKITE